MATEQITPEQALGMSLEEIEKFVAEDASGYFKPIQELEPWVKRSQELDPPRGGLPGGMMGPLGKAVESVVCEKGEHVIENVTSRFGVCRLRLMRLGKAIEPKLYLDQITAREGVSLRGKTPHALENGKADARSPDIHAWQWEEKSAGQNVYILLIVWVEGR